MNIFGFFVRLNHHRDNRKWKTAVAVFTGKCEKATVRTKMGPRAAKYNAYEIVYTENGSDRRGWYTFHPLEGPDPLTLAGHELRIRYRIDKPYLFEKEISEE